MACLTRLRVMACHTRLRVMACRVMSCTAACRSMRVNVDGSQVHDAPCRVMRPILPLLLCIESIPCRAVSFSLRVACQQEPGTSLPPPADRRRRPPGRPPVTPKDDFGGNLNPLF